MGYAFLKAKDPRQALSNEVFWAFGLSHSTHEFTKLEVFESRYSELEEKYPSNYGWYQQAFDQRVIEIYQHGGVDFLRQVQARFLRGRPPLNGAQVLDKLETMSPGWKAWSARVEAGNVSAKSF